jgi:hypothetical protein
MKNPKGLESSISGDFEIGVLISLLRLMREGIGGGGDDWSRLRLLLKHKRH